MKQRIILILICISLLFFLAWINLMEEERHIHSEENNICSDGQFCISGEARVGFGSSSQEEIEENKKRDVREGVVEYIDNEGITWKNTDIYFERHQPITIWENQDTGEIVEMLGYHAPSGRLIIPSN